MSVLENTPFDTKYQVFNSERRTSTGTTYVRDNPNDMYPVDFDHHVILTEKTGYKFRNMQKYLLNLTGHTDDNRLKVTMFTYANGVKFVREFSYNTIDGNNWVGFIGYYEDADGNYIDVNTSVGRIITDTPGAYIFHSYNLGYIPLDQFYMWAGTPGYVYDGDPSRNAYGFMANGVSFIPQSDLFPYAPDLVGDLDENYVRQYYSGPFYHDLWKQEWIDGLYETLENAGDGTPIRAIKPEDDTSKPDPDPDPDYNPFSDPIPFPDLPTTGDSISTGFIRVYNPSTAQLQNLAGFLWSDSFINTIKKIMNDPMEAIISLHSIPIQITTGASVECRVGNCNTGVNMPPITTQFYTIDGGQIYIPEHWASALDYSPYVTIDCFVPFVGVVQMQVDDIVGKNVHIKYNIDIISGAALVSIMCDDSVLYTYNTNVILPHPITQSSFGPLYQSVLSMVGSVASGAATGGAGGAVGGLIGGALNVAMSKHSNVNRGGTIGGATGVLGHFVPYLIIHRPIQSLASGFRHFKGYPSNITATLGSLTGYTEVESVHLEGLSCTDLERDEIMALLYNGVIF